MLPWGQQRAHAGQFAEALPGRAGSLVGLVLHRLGQGVKQLALFLQQRVAQVVDIHNGDMGQGGQVGCPDDLSRKDPGFGLTASAWTF